MNNILVFTPAYKEQTSQNMADFIKFCKDDLTLFNPNFNWDDNPPCVSIVVTPSEIRNWRQLSNYETLLT